MANATLSPQSTLSPAEIASSASPTYVCVVPSKHGAVVVSSQQDGAGRWTHCIPSHSRPGAHHRVTVTRNLFPLQGTCDCPSRATCWHVVAANAAENFVGEALHYIAKLQRPGCSADDYHHGAMLLARLIAAPQATGKAVA